HVVIVEDIVDSGLTLAYLRKNLAARGPASMEVCALLVKEGLQRVDLDLKYVGFTIPPAFVVGYGLDVGERYRNLPYIAEYAGKVASATIHDKDHTVTGTLKNGTEYTVNFPSQYTGRLTQDVVDAGVNKFDTDHQSQSAWLSLLYGLLPFVLLAFVLMWVLGQ